MTADSSFQGTAPAPALSREQRNQLQQRPQLFIPVGKNDVIIHSSFGTQLAVSVVELISANERSVLVASRLPVFLGPVPNQLPLEPPPVLSSLLRRPAATEEEFRRRNESRSRHVLPGYERSVSPEALKAELKVSAARKNCSLCSVTHHVTQLTCFGMDNSHLLDVAGSTRQTAIVAGLLCESCFSLQKRQELGKAFVKQKMCSILRQPKELYLNTKTWGAWCAAPKCEAVVSLLGCIMPIFAKVIPGKPIATVMGVDRFEQHKPLKLVCLVLGKWNGAGKNRGGFDVLITHPDFAFETRFHGVSSWELLSCFGNWCTPNSFYERILLVFNPKWTEEQIRQLASGCRLCKEGEPGAQSTSYSLQVCAPKESVLIRAKFSAFQLLCFSFPALFHSINIDDLLLVKKWFFLFPFLTFSFPSVGSTLVGHRTVQIRLRESFATTRT